MRTLVLGIAVFFYIFPIFIKYLPVPMDRILQVLGLGLFFLARSTHPLILNRKIFLAVRINFVVVVMAFFAMLNRPDGIDSYFFKQTLDFYFYFLSGLLIVSLFISKYKESFSIVRVFDLVVYLFAAQSVISFFFFMSPTLFGHYLSILNQDVNQGLFSRLHLLNKRFIGVGSAFFSGVVKYGFAFLIMMVLPYLKESSFYGKRIKYYVVLLLIAVGGVLNGRFFFLAIGLGLLLSVTIDKRNFFRLVYKGIPMVVVALGVFYLLGTYFLGADRFEIVFGFVFELFIAYFETGELSTSSSDATLGMYIFPDNWLTWLIGDGKMVSDGGGYYMGSDVGFIRLMFYFGAIAAVLYFVLHFFLYKVLIRNTPNDKIKKAFLFMFIWMVVYHGKGLVSSSEFLVLFLLATITERNRTRKYLNKDFVHEKI